MNQDQGSLGPWVPALLAAVPTSSVSRERISAGKPARAIRQQLDQALWAALDAGDAVALEQALVAGGSPKRVRSGTPPFLAAVARRRLDLAGILLAHGANPRVRGVSGKTAWGAIASRNDPEEGRALAALAGSAEFGEPGEFLAANAYDLLGWWLEQGNNAGSIPRPERSTRPSAWTGRNLRGWAMAVLDGPDELGRKINAAWGITPGDSRSLVATWGPSMGREVWEELAWRDNMALAQRALAMGWGPALPEDFALDVEHHESLGVSALWAHGVGWLFFSKQAWHLWEWWMAAEGLGAAFFNAAVHDPAATVWQVARDVPALERLVARGVSLDGRGGGGNTLLHHLAASKHFSLALARWWLAHRPEDFQATNANGHTPLDQAMGEANASMRAKVRALALGTAWAGHGVAQGARGRL